MIIIIHSIQYTEDDDTVHSTHIIPFTVHRYMIKICLSMIRTYSVSTKKVLPAAATFSCNV